MRLPSTCSSLCVLLATAFSFTTISSQATIVEVQNKPEHRRDQRAPQAFGTEQQMVEQNIYEDRPKNRPRQRNIAIDQRQRAANRLHCGYRQYVVRLE